VVAGGAPAKGWGAGVTPCGVNDTATGSAWKRYARTILTAALSMISKFLLGQWMTKAP
jgi:hypothetical protein